MSEVPPEGEAGPPRWEMGSSHPGYPACFADSPRPPKVLRGYGDTSLLRPGLAIVGARHATPYGIACARMFAARAASLDVIVISGAAVGCDSAAHVAALEAGGRSVAVLGCGADVDYPRSSAGLLRTMRGRHAVVSELPWGTQPTRWTFPERNRLIAALSAAVLVVEATLKSGTSHTAHHALDAGREVLAVPGSIFFAGAEGCNRLIADGATPISCPEDLDVALERCGLVPHCAHDTRVDAGGPVGVDPVLDAVLADPAHPDTLAQALGLDLRACLRRLTTLEQRGAVVRYRDGRYGPSGPASGRSR